MARRARRGSRLQRCSDFLTCALIQAHLALHGGSSAVRAEGLARVDSTGCSVQLSRMGGV